MEPRDQRLESTLRPGSGPARSPDSPVPTLTVLWHPDPTRVGEVSQPARLWMGQPVPLDRFEPGFSQPGDADPTPLESRFVSRAPVVIRPARPGLVLEAPDRARLRVAGRRVVGTVVVQEAELIRGVSLELGEAVALLLHLDPVPGAPLPPLGMVGEAPGLVCVRRELLRLAPLATPVLLLGETGTGKELAARALHAAGPRRRAPFVAVNLAAIAPATAQSALFGHRRGAFTGADRDHPGHFGAASRGTLLLDEIGAAPEAVQVLLLRALETGEIQPVGAPRPVPVTVRLVASTDRDLPSEVVAGRFRSALFHRLAANTVSLPPLRDRRMDLGRLLRHFLETSLAELGQPGVLPAPPVDPSQGLPLAILRRFLAWHWPGNVRELQNRVRRLVVASGGWPLREDALAVPNLAASAGPEAGVGASHARSVGEEELLDALASCGWRPGAAAAHLGISRTTLYALMRRSSRVRTARDLSREEVEGALAEAEGHLEAAAARLRVSPRGLQLRLRTLGLPPHERDRP